MKGFYLFLLFSFVIGIGSVYSNGEFVRLSAVGTFEEEDYPVCENPVRAKVYSVVKDQIIIHVEEEARADLFYYNIRVRGEDSSGALVDNGLKLGEGKVLVVNSIQYNSALAVEIQRVCITYTGIEVESEWVILIGENPVESRTSSNSNNAKVCEMFNGIETNYSNGDWFGDLSKIPELFGLLSINVDSVVVMFSYIRPRGDTIHVQYVLNILVNPSIYSNINISNLFGFDGSESGYIDVNLHWEANGLGGFLHSCTQVTIISLNPDTGLSCSDSTVVTIPSDSSTLMSLQKDDIFFINAGFPVRVLELESSTPPFRGVGILTIPFKEEGLLVRFDCTINQIYWVTSGTVTADGGVNISGVYTIGSATCYKSEDEWGEDGRHTVTGEFWDNNGFGQNGQYIKIPPYEGYEEGMPYDPNYNPCGFRANGEYLDTGKMYNEDGCSMQGKREDNSICDPWPCLTPYFWLADETPPSEGGLLLGQKYRDSIYSIVDTYIQTILQSNADSLTQYENCVLNKKTVILNAVTLLSLDDEILFGDDNEYIDVGCSQLVTGELRPLQVNISPRNDTIELIESTHVELYHCDVVRNLYQQRGVVLENELDSNAINQSKEEILYLIRRLSDEDIQKYDQDYNAFRAWVIDFLNNKFQSIMTGNYLPGPTDSQGGSSGKKTSGTGTNYGSEENTINGDSLYDKPGYISGGQQDPDNSYKGFKSKGGGTGTKSVGAMSSSTSGRLYTENELIALELKKIIAQRIVAPPLELRSGLGFIEAPIQINNMGSGESYGIILDNFILTPTSASLDAYAVIDDPNTGNKIVFSNHGITFGLNGFSQDSVRIHLETDVELKLINPATLRIKSGEGSYVLFNCRGYMRSGIEAEVEFCPNYIMPVDTITLSPIDHDTTRVKAYFAVEMMSWGNFVAGVSIDPFIVKDAPNLIWTIENAILDFSDITSPHIVFPENYISNLVNNDGSPRNEWKGFYLGELSVKMTGGIGNTDSTSISVSVSDMIIDDVGFTGRFGIATNLLSLDNGNLGGWHFSIDTVGVAIVANRLVGGGFGGLINVPFFKSTPDSEAPANADCFEYYANFHSDGSFEFMVKKDSSFLNANVWKAQVQLSNLSISGKVVDGEVTLAATFDGMVSISDTGGNISLSLPSIGFQGLTIRNQAPYVSCNAWNVDGGIGFNVGGFGFGISNINIQQEDEFFDLSFESSVSLANPDLDIAAKGYMRLRGEFKEVDGRQKFIYDSLYIDGFTIGTHIKNVITLNGGLVFYENHSTYGKGFYGIIEVTLPKLGNTSISAMAMFGRHQDGYKYFMVDLAANFPEKGIIVGPIEITGIGGGMYYHMTRQHEHVSVPYSHPVNLITHNFQIGQSLSGQVYVPDSTTFLGFKATVSLQSAAGESVFNGNASFEMAFYSQEGNSNKIGSIKSITFAGGAMFLTVPDRLRSIEIPSNGVIRASLDMSMYFDKEDNGNKKFELEGELKVYLNAGIIKGADNSEVDLLGKAYIYISKTKWQILIGTPQNKLGVVLSIPGLNNIAKTQSYFCVGNDIPDIPPLPSQLAHFNSIIEKENKIRALGSGMAGGLSFELNTGELNFLIFYASLSLGAGFDFNLRDYGDVICDGYTSQIGINGWYAKGQMYAYINGEIGIRYKSKRYSIIDFGAYAALRAEFPNPFYAAGTVGGRYSILLGLVKGECRFNFELGNQCTVGGSEAQVNLQIIEDVYPSHNSDNVSIFISPVVDVKLPINEEYISEDGEDTYLVKYETFKLYDSNGVLIPGKVNLTNMGHTMKFEPYFPLPDNDSLQFLYSLSLHRNGVLDETVGDTVSFTTGDRPIAIYPDNVIATYPIDGMMNFYKEEYRRQKGYIILKLDQRYLFEDEGNNVAFVRLVDSSGKAVILPHTYSDLTLEYDLPAFLLENGQHYTIELGRANTSENILNDHINISDFFPEVRITGQTLQHGDFKNFPTNYYDVVVYYQKKFRVSLYNNFNSKILDIFNLSLEPENREEDLILNVANQRNSSINVPVDVPTLRVNGIEPFDKFEISELSGQRKLIDFEANIQPEQFSFCDPLLCNYETDLHKRVFEDIPIEIVVSNEVIGRLTGDCGIIDCNSIESKSIRVSLLSGNNRIAVEPSHFNTTDFSDLSLEISYLGFSELYSVLSKLYNQWRRLWGVSTSSNNMIGQRAYYPEFDNHPLRSFSPPHGVVCAPGKNYAPIIITYTLPGKEETNSIIQNLKLYAQERN